MEKHATRLLALTLVLGAGAIGPDPGLTGSSTAVAQAGQNQAFADGTRSGKRVAWDCVPDYWWGYWTWAWQPCAWLDRKYVEGTIGAIAVATPSPAPASAAR